MVSRRTVKQAKCAMRVKERKIPASEKKNCNSTGCECVRNCEGARVSRFLSAGGFCGIFTASGGPGQLQSDIFAIAACAIPRNPVALRKIDLGAAQIPGMGL